MNKEYLNEEAYQKANNKVKWGGRIAILVGIAMILIGALVIKVPEMSANDPTWFGKSSARMTLIFLGIFITMVGLMIRFMIANRRNIMAYQTQQAMPIMQEGSEKMAPAAGKVAKEITKGVKEGLKEDDE